MARMSIQAAQRMGLRCISLDPGADTPASQIAEAIQGDLSDPDAVRRIFESSDRVTLENEFIPAEAIRVALEDAHFNAENLVPGVRALATIQDKLLQRRALERAGVPSPRAEAMESIEKAEADIGYPMVLKSRFGGYDGKGTRYARDAGQAESLRPLWGPGGWLVESFVPFVRELAVMVVRGPSGTFAYPTMETIQTDHICDLVFRADTDASTVAIAAVEAIGGYGLFGVELFDRGDGAVEVNEMAPRPHNTGHYTLDWEAPSQFETHVRVVCGLPIQPIVSSTEVVMANLLGQGAAGDCRRAIPAVLRHKGARLHWYGKAESRPARKMGHINVVGSPDEPRGEIVARAIKAREDFYQAWVAL